MGQYGDDSSEVNSSQTAAASESSQRFDELLTALAHTYRRYILYFFQDDDQASLTAIAQQIAAWEHECAVDDVSAESVASVEMLLSHNHLPKLRAVNIVEYDARFEMVMFHNLPDLVELCLAYCAPQDLPT